MPWSGGAFTRTNGVNTGATLWAQDRDDGTKILATRHDTNDQDMANGINSTLEKSGSNAATGNLNIGSNRLTAVADGTAKTDAATVNQIVSNAPAFQATDTGTANAHVIALSPAITAYAAGQEITFKSGAASTGASTLNVNTLGVKTLKKLHDQDIASGDIESGSIVTAVYDGTNFQVTSQLASEAADAGAAYAGVLQANANFVDQVIFGPSVDGVPWNGAWSKASVYSSLMLATIEDEGANTEINIWDLTEESAGVISTTPLATIDLANAATPTAIAAAMGYLIVSSEDGIAIIDPHSGAWAERTVGWPRTLSTSTTPALTDNNVSGVSANVWDSWPLDPRTGGTMPCFGIEYGAGADANSIIKYDGLVWDRSGTPSATTSVGIAGGRILKQKSGVIQASPLIDTIVADDWNNADIQNTGAAPYGLTADTGMDATNNFLAAADATGATFTYPVYGTGGVSNNAVITRAYNTGYMLGDIRGAWLANSKTVDRSYKANTLTENGTVTEGVVETSAELLGYSGFSASNNLTRASDADWDVVGTGSLAFSLWVKMSSAGGTPNLASIANSGNTVRFTTYLSSGIVQFQVDGATATDNMAGISNIADSLWHRVDVVQVSSTERYIYVDGVLEKTSTTDTGSLSDSGNLPLGIGVNADGSTDPAANGTLALVRLSATVPNATQIRQMYDAEKGMFVASAECLLQSGSTDAVLDVDVDPLSGKVIVTQTDAITIFDGLVVDSKPTVNSGNSEKGKLWGDLRAEQNSANAYVTAPATDQRQVNEMVRGLASDLPAGVDLSKAKAWIYFTGTGTIAINASYNVKSITDLATGRYRVDFAVPFKSSNYAWFAMGASGTRNLIDSNFPGYLRVKTQDFSGSDTDDTWVFVVAYGELENE